MGIQTQEITLDVAKRASTETVYLGQGDANGTTLRVNVTDGGAPYSLTGKGARLCIQLPHRGGSYEVDGTVSGNVATFDIDETRAAAVSGRSDILFVQVLSGTTVICSTARAKVVVRPSHSDGVPPARAWDNGVEAFLAQARTDLDEAIDEAAEEAASHQAVAIASKLPWPVLNSTAQDGDEGQVLLSDGEGGTQWGPTVAALTLSDIDAFFEGA